MANIPQSNWKATEITASQNMTNGSEVRTWMLANVPTSEVAYVVKKRDWSTNPTTSNEFMGGMVVGNTSAEDAYRWRNNKFTSGTLSSSYDFIVSQGDVFTVLYLEDSTP